MSSDSAFNPFEAPQSHHKPIPVVEEFDFAIDNNRILCHKSVRLPLVCIATGDVKELMPRSRVLRRLAGKYSFILILVAIASLTTAVVGSQATRSFSWLFVIVAALGLIGTIAVVALVGQQTVEVHWFVSKRHLKRNLRIRLALASGIALFFVALFFSISGEIPLIVATLTTVVTTLISFAYNPEVRIELIGKKEDLFVLRGPTKRFFQQVAINNLRELS